MIRWLTGDVLEVLPTLDAGSVDLVLTSPPFLALRSYLPADHPDKAKEGGSQATPGEYIDWLIDVVEALDRVLAPHGSLVVELGDTYAGSGGGGGDYLEGGWREGQAQFAGSAASMKESNAAHWRQKAAGASGWPAAKSLTLVPELFRLTLVYGHNPLTGRTTRPWRLRNVVRWVRPNPPVGALGDKFRPATSELAVLARNDEAGRRRFFDLDAVRVSPVSGTPGAVLAPSSAVMGYRGDPNAKSDNPQLVSHPAGAPPLDWWNIPPGGYTGAHYAVWPPALLVTPIKAMTPSRVCRTCGEPARRIVEPLPVNGDSRHPPGQTTRMTMRTTAADKTVGFSDCGHGDWRPGHVLDPFAGSGTTLAVADGHGYDTTGIDLDPRNEHLARDRIGPLQFDLAVDQ